MVEYIKRETARREFLNWAILLSNLRLLSYDDTMYLGDAIPAADVVEVVRCQTCKKFKTYKCPMCNLCSYDDFCSFGERKDGA